MTTSIGVAVLMAGALLFLSVLFHVETKKESRIILTSSRIWLDKQVLVLQNLFNLFLIKIGVGSTRIAVHYLIHTSLGVFVQLLKRSEFYLAKLQRRNRTLAKSLQTQKRDSHLSSLAEHKAANSLSESEKVALKEKHLEG